jgi:hypothetical protein
LGDFVVRSRFIVAAIRLSWLRFERLLLGRSGPNDDGRDIRLEDFVACGHVIVAFVRVFVVSSRTN